MSHPDRDREYRVQVVGSGQVLGVYSTSGGAARCARRYEAMTGKRAAVNEFVFPREESPPDDDELDFREPPPADGDDWCHEPSPGDEPDGDAAPPRRGPVVV